MKRWSGSVVVIILFSLLTLKYLIIENPLTEKSLRNILYRNSTETLKWTLQIAPNLPQNKINPSPFVVISTEQILANLTIPSNLTYVQLGLLHTWQILNPLLNFSNSLPKTIEAMQEAGFAWSILKNHIKNQNQGSLDGSGTDKKEQCPYSIREMNSSRLVFTNGNLFYLKIPCGMVLGSSLTVIGTPGGLYGSFKIELIGSSLPGEPDPPVVLHYNVRLLGDKVTEDPVIVQNTWTPTGEWGPEVRCPSIKESNSEEKVDGLEMCRDNGNRTGKGIFSEKGKNFYNITKRSLHMKMNDGERKNAFPYKQGFLTISVLRIGAEGMHMVVDGRHITSFPYRSNFEPWLIGNVRISGDIKLLSVIASGLPTTEKLGSIIDLEMLKSPQIAPHKSVDLFIGVVSTANNFKRRMAVRRTWMQYEDVRSGRVVVRFFVGLHKNGVVNEELWNEATTYGDIQILPFVDYYGLITWKTIAICIYGTDAVLASYVMKTDDDAFVRVDSILSSLKKMNITNGLLYGRINDDSGPHRDINSKWYITTEEWKEANYPPWAHGPGYVVSHDIAKIVHEQHKSGSLKMFKLEDVAMGIWVDNIKNGGVDVKYVKEDNINILGCKENYVVAHYQEPRDLHCLWEKLLETKRPLCCN
ncbi:beta-1,3-galactosyltransferase GALT1-like [Carex rostrata]